MQIYQIFLINKVLKNIPIFLKMAFIEYNFHHDLFFIKLKHELFVTIFIIFKRLVLILK